MFSVCTWRSFKKKQAKFSLRFIFCVFVCMCVYTLQSSERRCPWKPATWLELELQETVSWLYSVLETLLRSSASTVGAHALLIPKPSLKHVAILNPNIASIKMYVFSCTSIRSLSKELKMLIPMHRTVGHEHAIPGVEFRDLSFPKSSTEISAESKLNCSGCKNCGFAYSAAFYWTFKSCMLVSQGEGNVEKHLLFPCFWSTFNVRRSCSSLPGEYFLIFLCG